MEQAILWAHQQRTAVLLQEKEREERRVHLSAGKSCGAGRRQNNSYTDGGEGVQTAFSDARGGQWLDAVSACVHRQTGQCAKEGVLSISKLGGRYALRTFYY